MRSDLPFSIRGLAVLLAVALAGAAVAQPTPRFHRPKFEPGETSKPREKGEKLPEVMRGAKIEEKLEVSIPRDLVFRNASDERVRLGRYFDQDRPVILNFGYFTCPMLCGLVRRSLTGALSEIDLAAGEEYEVLSISIDPEDGPEKARAKKRATLERMGESGDADGWHFLTSDDEKAIERLTAAVGWGYNYNEKRGEYAHSAAFVIATPSGKVSRYIYGLEYSPDTLRLSLVEASEGAVGSAWDKVVIYCCRYDPEAGGYSVIAMNVMRVAGGVTVLALAGGIGIALAIEFTRRRRARRRQAA